MIQIGPVIRELREQRGLTQKQLQKLTGVSWNTIALLERGETSPTLATIEKLLEAFGYEVRVLPGDPNNVDAVVVEDGLASARQKIKRFVRDPRVRGVLLLRQDGETLEEIGECLEVSKERARQLEAAGEKELRAGARKKVAN